ncbi:MAG: HEAT repeat domain-containing protein [Planctomycetes bacterium]|nr:HEAT repeat domain-containing protein [Planctomycetota bacterium]
MPVPVAEAVPPYQPPLPPKQYPAPQPQHHPASPPREVEVELELVRVPTPQPRAKPQQRAKATARPLVQPANKKGFVLLAGVLIVGGGLGLAAFFLLGDKSQPERSGHHHAKKDDTPTPEHKQPDETVPEPVRPKPTPPAELLPEAGLAERKAEDISANSVLVLKSGTVANRIIAAQRLGNLKAEASSALPALIAALDNPDPQLQTAIGEALVQIGAPKPGSGVERMLLAALRSKSPQARTYAAALLAAEPMLTVESVKPLVAALKDDLPEIRANCAQAIGKVGPKAQAAAFEPLLDLVVDTDETVSLAAAEAIPTLGPPNATLRPALVTRLKNNDVRMRLIVAPLLAALPSKGDDTLRIWQPLLKDGEPKLRLVALNALSPSMELIAEAGTDVMRLLSDTDPAVRKAAAHCAMHIGKTIGAPTAIAKAFETETDPAVKLELATSLVTLVKPDLTNLGAFRHILKDGSPELREQAAQKLATIGRDAQETLPELTVCIGDESPGVRIAALKALAALGTDCKPALPMVAGLFDKEKTPVPVLAAAVEVLGAVGADGLTHLEKLIKKTVPPEVKEQMCLAFSKNKFLSEPVQLWLVDQAESLPKSREVIAKALAKKGSDATVESMLRYTHIYKPVKGANPPEMYPVEIRQWMVSVLGKMDLKADVSQETRTKVIDRMKYLSKNDKTPEIVTEANAVLKKLN